MIALDNDNFRRDYNKAWELYLEANKKFVDMLTLKQTIAYRKLCNRSDRTRNMIPYNELPIHKITSNKAKLEAYRHMSELYENYRVLANRSELKLVA